VEHNVRQDDLSFAFHLADIAARVTLDSFGVRIPVELKADSTPVTAVDAATERAIRAEIAATYPNDGVLGEEGGLREGTNERMWVVDPIDGTQMYAEGIPLWTTLIGLRYGNELAVAVADAPALRERYHATAGSGSFCGEQPIRVSTVATLGEAFVLHAPVEGFARGTGVDALLRLTSAARGSRGIGDAWAHLLVARGAADALVEQGPCFEWDWAATSLIVTEAGGALSRLEGGAPTPGSHLLVSNGTFDPEIRRTLYPDVSRS
jgi:histidinol-phosphatase